jgi:hypothetical protein
VSALQDRQPAPVVSEVVVDALAHCLNPRCEGYGQTPVKAIRQTVETLFISELPLGTENSYVHLRFVDDADVACPHCGRARAVTEQERPIYEPLSGFAQDELITRAPKFDPNKVNTEADFRAAEMEAKLALQEKRLEEQNAKIDKLLEALGEPAASADPAGGTDGA